MPRSVSLRAAIAACLVIAAIACRADSYSEGRDLYKAGRYQDAAAKFEQATKVNPNDAKAWWQLNFAYHKLGRDAEALAAVKKAGQLDPAHTFASTPGKYEEVLGNLQRASGTGGAPTGAPARRPGRSPGRSSGETGGGSIVTALLNGDVYVAPGANADAARLQQVANELKPQATVKFVVFNSNSGSRTLASEADRIRTYLSIGNGYVIAASHRGVAASSRVLDRESLRRLTNEVSPQMEAGEYTAGLERLARGLVTTHRAQVAHTQNTWLVVVLVIAGIVVLWIVLRSLGNARRMAARREPVERLRSDVVTGINYLDDSMGLVSGADANRVRDARVSAGTKLDEASRILAHAKSDRDILRAQTLLDQAQADIASGRSVIDRATGAATSTSAPAGAEPPVYSGAQAGGTAAPNLENVPQDQKGVCFFCSRPSLLSELTPVTVNLDGKQQRVLACPDDVATIKTGQMPQIRAFQQNGQYVPWYAYQGYDPYRDYYSRGYDNRSLLSDLVTFSVIDSMFWNWHHPMGWGWGGGWGGYGGNTYVFYPEHEGYRDYYSDRAAGSGDFDRTPDTAAGTDFLQGSGGDLSGTDRS